MPSRAAGKLKPLKAPKKQKAEADSEEENENQNQKQKQREDALKLNAAKERAENGHLGAGLKKSGNRPGNKKK